MKSAESESPAGDKPERPRAVVLCAGIAVQDFMFRVDRFPTPATKSVIHEFLVTGGGCAANAAITVARLGGRARFAGPLGDDDMSDRVVDGLVRAGVDIGAVERVPGAIASVSGIFVDAAGERLLTTRREQGLATARPTDPARAVAAIDVALADNHFPDFVIPICQAARHRRIPVVLDVDKATRPADPLLGLASHAIFSAEALRGTVGSSDCDLALDRISTACRGFVAVTDGERGVFWRGAGGVRHLPAFAVTAQDTLAAGDVFHGAFALALAEGRDETEGLRFASAAAALKCTRFGGIVGAPNRRAVERLLQSDGLTPGIAE
jgi:sulfofructose kinase